MRLWSSSRATPRFTRASRPGAMTMVDNDTGAVKVMASGLPFDFSQFDLAVQGRRNPGSAFKPFGLVTALEQGYTMGHHWSGESPIKIQCQYPCAPDGSNIWTVHNAGASTGVIPLSAATYGSVNAVYAQVSLAVGPDNIVDVARRMGIDESPLDPVLSIVLGSSAVSTVEMASAFSNFATDGLHADDYVIAKIVDSDGNTIYEKQRREGPGLPTQRSSPQLGELSTSCQSRGPHQGRTSPSITTLATKCPRVAKLAPTSPTSTHGSLDIQRNTPLRFGSDMRPSRCP